MEFLALSRETLEILISYNGPLSHQQPRQRVGLPGQDPKSRRRIPRNDMLPILSIFSLGMSGVNAPFGSSEQNDGVVDTVLMRGPENGNNPINESDFFNTAALASNRGVYWHFGVTEGKTVRMRLESLLMLLR